MALILVPEWQSVVFLHDALLITCSFIILLSFLKHEHNSWCGDQDRHANMVHHNPSSTAIILEGHKVMDLDGLPNAVSALWTDLCIKAGLSKMS